MFKFIPYLEHFKKVDWLKKQKKRCEKILSPYKCPCYIKASVTFTNLVENNLGVNTTSSYTQKISFKSPLLIVK